PSYRFCCHPRPRLSTLFPYTTLFRSRPVLVVVFVTLMINVLKIFDLVFVIPPDPSDATVIAYDMWAVSFGGGRDHGLGSALAMLDRKSTRLNSSHVKISYAVFCLKKK